MIELLFSYPSPYGDYGSYETIQRGYPVCTKFPSPYGDCGSYQVQQGKGKGRTTRFRPLTGIVVLIAKHSILSIQTANRVSVPLRGLWFLSGDYIVATGEVDQWFPSPYGDCGSYLSAV